MALGVPTLATVVKATYCVPAYDARMASKRFGLVSNDIMDALWHLVEFSLISVRTAPRECCEQLT